MPSKNSKDFINKGLAQTLTSILSFLESVVSESDGEPDLKRQKVDAPKDTDKLHA